jgi:hypothetical protein
MKALELKNRIDAGDIAVVTVRDMAELPLQKGEYPSQLADFGDSLCGESTYFNSRMRAKVVRCFAAPELPPLPNMPDYRFAGRNEPFKPGFLYFIFDTESFHEHNETIADRNWTNDEGGVYRKGTGREVNAYTGFDVIGFAPDMDLTPVFSGIEFSK